MKWVGANARVRLASLWADGYVRAALLFWLLLCGWLIYHLSSLPPYAFNGYDTTHSYFAMATDFLQGFGPSAMLRDGYRGPGYPSLLALVTLIAGSVQDAAKWIKLAAWPIFLALSFLVIRRATDSRRALGVLLLLSVSPTILSETKWALTDVVFLVLMYAALLAALTRRYLAWLLAGALTGLALTVRWQGLVLAIGIVSGSLFIWWRSRRDWRAWAVSVALFIGGLFLTAGPFLYLNQLFRGSALANNNLTNFPVEWLPDGVERRGPILIRDQGREVIGSLPELILIDPGRILGGWAREATTGALLGRLTFALPGGYGSRMATVFALCIPIGALALLRICNRRLAFLLCSGFVVWWGCLPLVSSTYGGGRVVMPVVPLAFLTLVALWFSDLIPSVPSPVAVRSIVINMQERVSVLRRLTRHPGIGRVFLLSVLVVAYGLLSAWPKFVSGVYKYSFPQSEVLDFLDAEVKRSGWRPVVAPQKHSPLLYFVPDHSRSGIRTIGPRSPLMSTSPYLTYDQEWSGKDRWDWDVRLPLNMPPELELTYYKPDGIQAAVLRRLAENHLASMSGATASTTAPPTANESYLPQHLIDNDALTGWKSAPQPVDPFATEWMQLEIVQTTPLVLEMEQFSGVAAEEYSQGTAKGKWMRYSLPWMSNGSAALILAPGLDKPLTQMVALQPGGYEVSLRAFDYGDGGLFQAQLTLGDSEVQFAWGGSDEKRVMTSTQSITLTTPVTMASFALERMGPWAALVDSLSIRPLHSQLIGQPINRIWLMPWPEGGMPGGIEVETSMDGRTWQTVARQPDVPPRIRQSPVVLEFSETRAAYVRITGRRLRSSDGLPLSDPNRQQWMGFAEVRVSLGHESVWARTQPSVEVGPDLQVDDDGAVTVVLTNTAPAPFSVDVTLYVHDQLTGIRIPVSSVWPQLRPGVPATLTRWVPGDRMAGGPVLLEVWVDKDGLTAQGRQTRLVQFTPTPGKIKLEAESFEGVQPWWNEAQEPDPQGWVYYPRYYYSSTAAALVKRTDQAISQAVKLAPGDYTVGLRVYDYGDGQTQSVKVMLGNESQELTWGSATEGVKMVEAQFHLATAAERLTLRSVNVPTVVDFVSIHPH